MSEGLQQHDRQPPNGRLHFSCSALAEVLPALLQQGWIHSMCSTVDDTIIVQARFHDGRWVKLEIEDSEHIGAALPDEQFRDFTTASLIEWVTQNAQTEAQQ